MFYFNIRMSEMKTFEIADGKQPKKRWRDRENSLKIAGFEMPNEFIREVTESATERAKKKLEIMKVRDNGYSR